MKINEIFKSIQGETTYQGLPAVFIRTTGCNLRCSWCDTTYAYSEGNEYSIEDILKITDKYSCKDIVITGGEPLTQDETPLLIDRLITLGHTVLLETNGSLDISIVHPDTIRILDIKCPGSGMSENMMWNNIKSLKPHDEVKFVVSDYNDYIWAKSVIESYNLVNLCHVLVMPVFARLDPKALAGWIINDNLDVRLQLQIHKYIWGPDTRGV